MARPDEIELQQQQAAAGQPISTLSPLRIAPPPPPPTPKPQVVDRVLYLQQQRQAQIEAEQSAAMQRQRLQQLYNYGQSLNPLPRAEFLLEQVGNVDVSAYGYDPANPMTWADAERKAREEANRRYAMGIADVKVRYPNDEQTLTQGAAQFAGEFGKTAQNALGPAIGVARTDIPESIRQPAIDVVEQLNRGNSLVGPISNASNLANMAGFDVPSGQEIRRGTAELVVPREVWELALEFVPNVGTVDDIVRAAKAGSPEALNAARKAAARLGQSEAVERGLRALTSGESGAWKPFGDEATEFKKAVDEIERLRGEASHIRALEMELRDAERLNKPRVAARLRKDIEAARTSREQAVALEKELADLPKWRFQFKGFGIAAPEDTIIISAPTEELARYRAAKSGISGGGLRSVERVSESPTRALTQGEGGALQPEKVVPDSVVQIFSKRGQRETTYQVTRKAKEPITEAELAQRWEMLPPTHQKLITSMADVVLTPTARATAKKAGHARQAAMVREAVEQARAAGANPDEIAAAARRAAGGRIIPGFEPLAPLFDDAEVGDLYGALSKAYLDDKSIHYGEFIRANEAMDLLFYGARQDEGPLNLMPNEIKLLGRIFGPELEAVLPRGKEQLTLWQKMVRAVGVPRMIQTALDFSAPGRQGIILGARNPDFWFQAFKRQFQAAGLTPGSFRKGEEAFESIGEELRRDPHFEDAINHGLDLTDVGGGVKSEEGFINEWAQAIPGVKQSERAYVSFLDYLRLKSYGRGADRIRKFGGKHNWDQAQLDEALEKWAFYVSVASGRGDLKALNKFTPALNAVLFSPRFFVSRPQTIWQLIRPGTPRVVRQQVFENLGLYFGLGASLLATLKMTGAADVEMDPRSTDFGKIRVGPQRIDFWGGLQPMARYLAQASMRERKDPYANENVDTGVWNSVRRFMRSKLSPQGAVAWDLLFEGQKDYEGKAIVGDNPYVSIPKYALDRIAPLGLMGIVEGYLELGPKGVPGAALGLVGAGVQTYSPTEKQESMQRLEEAGINVTYQNNQPVIRTPELEKDWQSPKWHALFQEDFAELGDTTRFGYFPDMRKAYIDYWWDKKGDVTGVGEKQRKEDLGNAFDGHESAKLWDKNSSAEKLKMWQQDPELLLDAVRSGLEELNQDERQILEEEGLLD